jgi:uncharacterized membrane protein
VKTTLSVFVSAFLLSFATPAFADDPKPAEAAKVEESKDEAKAEEAPAEEAKPAEAKAEEAAAEKPAAEKPAAELPEIEGAPKDVSEAIGLITEIVSAFKGGKWGLAIGLIIMILLYVLRMFWSSLPSKVMPYMAAAAGGLGGLAMGLTEGALWYDALITGASYGLMASGLWSIGGKKILAKKATSEG